jgi:hypothetical protein
MLGCVTRFASLREIWMSLNKFREFYERMGFWAFWIGILGLALIAYGLVMFFAEIVGPYVVGLWLTQGW